MHSEQLSTVTMTFWTHVTHTICPTTAMQNILNDIGFNVTNSVSAHLRLNTTLSKPFRCYCSGLIVVEDQYFVCYYVANS